MLFNRLFADFFNDQLPSLTGLWLMDGAVQNVNEPVSVPNILTASYAGLVLPYYSWSNNGYYDTLEASGLCVSQSSDGKFIYLLGADEFKVIQINLPIANDAMALGADRVVVDPSAFMNESRGFEVSADGHYCYFVGESDYLPKIVQCSLSTPYRAENMTVIDSMDVSSFDQYPYEVRLSADGLQFFLFGENNVVYGFTRPDQANFSSSVKDQELDLQALTGVSGDLTGFCFDATGTKLFATGYGVNVVHQITLQAPYDFSGAVYDGGFDISSETSSAQSCLVTRDNQYLVVYDQEALRVYRIEQGFFKSNVLVDFSAEISAVTDRSFNRVPEPDGLKLEWNGGVLSGQAASAGNLTHFIAKLGGQFAVGTISASGGGGDLELASTNLSLDDDVEISNFSIKLNGMIG